jgi:hypothetical protein
VAAEGGGARPKGEGARLRHLEVRAARSGTVVELDLSGSRLNAKPVP